MYDFTSRLEQGCVNKRGLESLVNSGAFDSLNQNGIEIGEWRAKLYKAINGAVSYGQKVWDNKIKGQEDLFASFESDFENDDYKLPEAEAWSEREMASREKNAVGFYLSIHPLDTYSKVLDSLQIKDISSYAEVKTGERIKIAGQVSKFQAKHSKKGNLFCIFRIEDKSNQVKCLAWAETYKQYSSFLKDDELLIVEGRVESNEGQEITLIIDEARNINDIVFEKASTLMLTLPKNTQENAMEEMVSLLSSSKGGCHVYINLELENDIETRVLAEPFQVSGSSELESKLKEIGCKVVWN